MKPERAFSLSTEEVEDWIEDIWSDEPMDTADMAACISSARGFPVSEARVANALASVRDRRHQSQLAEAV